MNWAGSYNLFRFKNYLHANPLYPSVTKAVQNDPKLHELIALVDALRVGRAREKEIAIKELKARILND